VLLLFNHSAVPKYFNVKIGDGGVLWQQAYLLAPMETRAIRIRELIAAQVKDQYGKVLAENLERGEIGWFTANPAEGAGRLMQINPVSQTVAADTRVARNFSCSYSYVVCGASVAPASTTFYDGQVSSQLEAVPAVCLSVSPFICSGQSSSYGGLGYTYQWTASAPAQVYGPSTESIAFFLGTGAGTGYAYVTIRAEDNGGYYCQATGFGNLSVAPSIGSISPTLGLAGSTVTVTITGVGFSTSGTIIAGGGITANVQSWSDTQIVAQLQIPSSAEGPQNIQVQVAGQTSQAKQFTGQLPRKLIRYNFNGAPNGIGPLTTITNGNVVNLAGQVLLTNQCGVYRNYAYTLVDKNSNEIDSSAAITFWETFSNYKGPATLPKSQSTSQNLNSVEADIQYFGKNASAGCPGPNDNESFTQNFYVILNSTRYDLSTTISISRGYFSGTAQVNETITIP
jgi:hypothetical protein